MTNPLSDSEWLLHHNMNNLEGLVNNVRSKNYSAQTLAMLEICGTGKKILEIGSGSGETSLSLQLNGNYCTALDFNEESLMLTKSAASKLGIQIDTIHADAKDRIEFEENYFDVVFQAGLLEHFHKNQRIELLTNWGRCTKRMVSIIPNAACIIYQMGAELQKRKGNWAYGLELPQFTLQEEFRQAGFKVISEYTIAPLAAFEFLPKYSLKRKLLELLLSKILLRDECHQGYLLVTIGDKLE